MHIFFCWIHWVFHCYGWDFSRCSKQRLLFAAVGGLLVVVASLVAEHGLQACKLSSCGSWAQLPLAMWDPPRPGIEPISPALSGRFLTSGPPGSPDFFFKHTNHQIQMICVFFLKNIDLIYLCTGSFLLQSGILQFWRVEASLVGAYRLLIAVASLVVEHRLQARGLQQLLHVGSVVWHVDSVALRHVGSSWTRD